MTVEWLNRQEVERRVADAIHPADVVLDIGCGLRPQGFFRPAVHLLCEPHEEYVSLLEDALVDEPGAVVLRSRAQELLPLLPDRSVDSVFLLDVVEHLSKTDGRELLSECERVARCQIVVFTPLGFLPQTYAAGERDAWGFEGREWQTHRSGWAPSDFGSDWRILGCRHFHEDVNGDTHGAFWALRDLNGPATLETVAIATEAEPASRVSGWLAGALSQLPRAAYCVLTSRVEDPYDLPGEAHSARPLIAVGRLPGRHFKLPLRRATERPLTLRRAVAGRLLVARARRMEAILRRERCSRLLVTLDDPLNVLAGWVAARRLGVDFGVLLVQSAGAARGPLHRLVERRLLPSMSLLLARDDQIAATYRACLGVDPAVVRSGFDLVAGISPTNVNRHASPEPEAAIPTLTD